MCCFQIIQESGTGKSGIFQKVWRINFSTHSFWNICDGKNFSVTDISWIIWKKKHIYFSYFHIFGIFIFITFDKPECGKRIFFWQPQLIVRSLDFLTSFWIILQGLYFQPIVCQCVHPNFTRFKHRSSSWGSSLSILTRRGLRKTFNYE